jgi:hypothetical protein
VVLAQTPAPKADDHAAHHTDKTAAPGPGTTQPSDAHAGTAGDMMGGGMMGGGMMGGGCPMSNGMMGSGMGPMVGNTKTKVEVKKIDKGVTITFTSTDAATVARLQKMAEAMRLMHEANMP